jgi:hypothetical protein
MGDGMDAVGLGKGGGRRGRDGIVYMERDANGGNRNEKQNSETNPNPPTPESCDGH